MKRTVLLPLVLLGCSYDYVIDPSADTSATGSTSTGAGASTASAGGGNAATTSSGGGGDGAGGEGAGGEGAGGEGAGGSIGTPCDTVDTCPTPEGECQIAVCEPPSDGAASVCGVADRPDGTEVGEQQAGDCVARVCVGGTPTDGIPADDPPADLECMTYACDGGQVVETPVAIDTACGADGSLQCDGEGACVGCTDVSDCGTAPVCQVMTCTGAGECAAVAGPDGDHDANGNDDCRKRVCAGGILMTVLDASDPASDGDPCTLDVCNAGTLTTTHPPMDPGSSIVPCTGGVCQTGTHVGTCGLSLYSRPFPASGTWTRVPLSAAWTGSNAPPPTGILVAEETSDGARLMVIRSNGMYHQFSGGAWQQPVTATTRFASLPVNVSAMLSGRFGANELIIFTTSSSPPQAINYRLDNGVGNFIHEGGPGPVTNESGKPNAPPQHTTTMNWSIGEQRSAYPGAEDAHVTWKGTLGNVYEQWAGTDPGFYYPNPPVAEASSPFGLNGSNNAPSAGTIAAAFYRNATNTVYFVAP